MSRALVLGGGGLAGIAWEIGLLAELTHGGSDLTAADTVIGTSAGSVVGALLRTGQSLDEQLAAHLEGAGAGAELTVKLDVDLLANMFGEAISGARDLPGALSRIGAMALATPTVSEAERRRVIEARLPRHEWPARRLLVTAIDAERGTLVTFDKDSGVPLVDAVAASCAVPGVWPPVSIDGRRYLDGGSGSATNATLAAGHDTVLVMAPMTTPGRGPFLGIEDEVHDLEKSGSRVLVVTADDAARAAFGLNSLDPAVRPASARAGRRQGWSLSHAVREFWTAGAAGAAGA
ncbi:MULTISPECIES: patatin-like phospholipase family protein [unclassified Pseudofrankia]|uniref:patatin-like phospholipase family protein n=1 Tax=unclassified Pseudofrankia TaxID=2994372 RepID=UPI0008D9EEDA|nr:MULTISPECIES: patatin-like phospholipase family protein [unclassified Pseudofrankia]MDT3440074.1 patatin-like phospholipase family protein [Pseudofrankia sp. BMG5.37]OHV44697.1 patatin [Pseudofrankia sp. BMG5.36]